MFSFDTAFRRCEAAYLTPPDFDRDDEADALAAEAEEHLRALEDAGCDVLPADTRGHLWTVTFGGALLGSGADRNAAVADAYPVAAACGLVAPC